MENPLTWTPEDWTARESLEATVTALGGEALYEAQATADEMRHTFEGMLPKEKQRFYRLTADAGAEAALERESVVTRIALLHGLGMGAALAVHGRREDPALLVDLAARLVTELLVTRIAPERACDVAATVIDALRLAGVGETEPPEPAT